MITLLALSALTLLQPPPADSDIKAIPEFTSIQAGKPFTLDLHIRMPEGWHTYWVNPGDSGFPVNVKWTLPTGFTASALQFPYPQRLEADGTLSYVYQNSADILVTITPPKTLAAGSRVAIKGEASWLVCNTSCLPANGVINVTLPVKATVPVANPQASMIAETRSRVPITPTGWKAVAAFSEGKYILRLSGPSAVGFEKTTFFPLDGETISVKKPPVVARDGNSLVMTFSPVEDSKHTASRFRGVLVAPFPKFWDAKGTAHAIQIDVPVGIE